MFPRTGCMRTKYSFGPEIRVVAFRRWDVPPVARPRRRWKADLRRARFVGGANRPRSSTLCPMLDQAGIVEPHRPGYERLDALRMGQDHATKPRGRRILHVQR